MMRCIALSVVSTLATLSMLAQPAAAELAHRDIHVNDVRMHYAEAGSGAPLVLLHGLWGGNNEWSPIIDALAEDHRVIALDLPGFHQSEKLATRYSNAALAKLLSAFIRELALQNVTLVGHAMGANLATYTAYHFPENIGALVLIDGAGYRNPNRDLSQPPSDAMAGFIKVATGNTLETTRGLLERRVVDASLVDDDWVAEAHAMWKNAAAAIADMLREGGDLTEEQMRQIRVPTLVVWGAEDKVFSPDNATRLQQDINGVDVAIVENAGHLPQIEQTDAFLTVILAFLDRPKDDQ